MYLSPKINLLLLVSAIAQIFAIGISFNPVQAQSIKPAADGTNTQVNTNGNQIDINGGTRAGANLFHSFEKFGLNQNEIANFLSTGDIQNILGRITGGNPSVINGLIQVTGGNPNLFLVNPSGIFFGPNATLNVPADFTATTATNIGIGENWFNAVGENNYANLTGNPNSFIFSNLQPGSIINSGKLTVNSGSNLNLLGGTVASTGELTGGNITVATVPGENLLRITPEGQLLSLEIPASVASSGDISVTSLPELLTGSGLTNDTGLTVNSSGQVELASSGNSVNTGDVVTTKVIAEKVTLSAENSIEVGNVDTSSQENGSVNLSANKNITAESITTNGGNISLLGTKGNDSTIKTGELIADSSSGNSGSITLNAADGQIEAEKISTIGSSKGGDIFLIGNEIDLIGGTNSVDGGSISFLSGSGDQNIVIGDSTDNGTDTLDLTTSDLNALNDGFSLLSVSSLDSSTPLDIFLLQDLSSSFDDDLEKVEKLVPELVENIRAIQSDSNFGVGSFVDKPLGDLGGSDDYVYRTDQAVTNDTTQFQDTVNNLTIKFGGDGLEAQLEALLQVANRTSEVRFRSDASNVVVLSTDASYHQAGDGAGAGITTPNNGDGILDGNPPGTGEDYPSVEQVRDALESSNITPIFAVTSEEKMVYQDLVDKLGRGTVVELNEDSSNLVDAITKGVGNTNLGKGKITLIKDGVPTKLNDLLSLQTDGQIITSETQNNQNQPPQLLTPNQEEEQITTEAELPITNTTEQIETATLAEDIEEVSTEQFLEFAGDDNVKIKTVKDTQGILGNIGQRTGVKPAAVYTRFLPEKYVPGSSLVRQDKNSDVLNIIIVTAEGKPIRKQIKGATRGKVLRAANRFTREISNPRRANSTRYLTRAKQLYEWLVKPYEAEMQQLGVKNLMFIMDPGLRQLPVAALHDGKQFVIEKYSIGLLPSISLTDTRYAGVQNSKVLAMGTSTFTKDQNQRDLPAVSVELPTIAGKLWEGKYLLGENFTLDNLKSERANNPYGIIHLATHADFPGGKEGRKQSYIQLYDSKLRLENVRQLGWNNPPVELLVLSACRTALGDLEAELGYAGLAVQTGVKSAVASLWFISDAGTLGVMTEFYRQLNKAPIKAEALRQTQLAMLQGNVRVEGNQLIGTSGNVTLTPEQAEYLRNNINGELSHPYYWASFTMIGSPW